MEEPAENPQASRNGHTNSAQQNALKESLDTPMQDSSWQAGLTWYDQIVGDEGHYYHRNVVFPRLEKLFALPSQGPFLVADLGCGQGVLDLAPLNIHRLAQVIDLSELFECNRRS